MKSFLFIFLLSSIWLFHPIILYSVEPLMIDESDNDILPIKPLEPLTISSFPRYLLFSSIIIAMICIIVVVLRKKRNNLHTIQKQNVILSPYLEAMSAVNQLEKETYCKNKEVRSGYFVLSKILRTYISRSFAIQASDLTTEEIRPLLENEADEGWHNAVQFMELMDIKKFSDITSSDKEFETFINAMREFVVKTRCETVTKNKCNPLSGKIRV